MIHTIRNEKLTCSIDSRGAQLISLSSSLGTEYIWTGEKDIWPWHAPVLFPCCGSFPDGFLVDDRIYHLPQHGFLRNVEHKESGEGIFLYESMGEEEYPFALSARTSFCLEESTLIHRLEIENRDRRPMPYSMGFHTGFLLENATLEFECDEEELGGRIFRADDSTLEKTCFFTKLKSRRLLCSDAKGKRLELYSPEFTTLVLWTMKGHSRDFICIEPRVDTVAEGARHPFKRVLEPGGICTLEERITILG